MARATKVSKATEDEHMELEAAMSELSKQTDALLAQAKPKSTVKPKLPTKKIVPHNKGASLDIVGHAPSNVRRKPSEEFSKKNDHEDLLPAKATYSYNETTSAAPSKKSDQPVQLHNQANKLSVVGNKAIIKPHEGRRLEVSADSNAGTVNLTKDLTDSTDKTEHIRVDDQDTKVAAVSVNSEKRIDSTEGSEPKDESKDSTIDLKESLKDAKISGVDDTSETSEKTVESTDQTDDEDGIVKMDDDKEKPTVYDVTEYQAELHDWSKLSGNSHWSVVVLLVLLAVAIGLMYLYFTNNLPKLF